VAWAEFSRVQGLHGKGELRPALQAAQAALALCEQSGETRLATWLDPMAAVVAADLGDDESARMHAQRALEHAQQLNQLVLSAWALHAQGYGAMQRGDTRAALEWYEQYLALVRDTENGVARHLVMARAAEAYFLSGRLDDAARLTERAIADATFANAPHYLALARRVQGQILGAQKRYDEAMSAFDEAIAAFTATGSRLELARTMYHRAALRFELGDRDAARADAANARDEFEAIKAVRDRAMAEVVLSK
jgi:tetratricopeptide (TPR) repeat protein